MRAIIQITAVFSALIFATSCSCDKYNEAKEAVSAVRSLAENAENIQESMEEANKRMNVLPEGLQGGFPGNQRVPTIGVDHEKCREARCHDGPQEGHAVGCTRLGHGRNAPGADVESEQENARQKQCQRSGESAAHGATR